MVNNNYNERLYVYTGEPFNIPLASNPTTGYEWKLTAYPPFIRIIDEKYYPDPNPTGMLGVGGTQVFTFIADNAGEGLLIFDYTTPWGEHGGFNNIYLIAQESNSINNNLEKHALERSDSNNSIDDNINASDIIFSSDSKQMEDYNQKYFRPSYLPALNTRNLNDMIIKIHQKNPTQIAVPKELMLSPLNTIINYYSILREAISVTEGVGCGTVGMMQLPYPIAYNFLSANYQKRLTYEEYLKSFQNIAHINLIKAIKNKNLENDKTKKRYYIELELITPPGNFEYSFGTIDIIKEDNQYKIDNIEISVEEYFCAPYHFWQHNAELKIDIMYGSWSKLIATRYPTVESEYKKNIYIKGTDGNNYLFTFIKLTNGTDVEIGQYKQSYTGEWIPINI